MEGLVSCRRSKKDERKNRHISYGLTGQSAVSAITYMSEMAVDIELSMKSITRPSASLSSQTEGPSSCNDFHKVRSLGRFTNKLSKIVVESMP